MRATNEELAALRAKGREVTLRIDGRIEVVCEHGVGHTTEESARRIAEWNGKPETWEAWAAHGCDGCCDEPVEVSYGSP